MGAVIMEQAENKNEGKMKVVSIMSMEQSRVKIAKIEDAYRIFTTLLKYEDEFLYDKEHLWVLAIDEKGYASCAYIAALGLERINMANAFDLFKVSLNYDVKKIIIAHNQIEAGEPRPQEIDLDYTNRIWHKARIINVELEDHIIITKDSLYSKEPIYYSYKEHGLIEIIAKDMKYKSLDESKEVIEKEKQDAIDDAVIEVVKSMLANNEDISKIIKYTGLSQKEINNIKSF